MLCASLSLLPQITFLGDPGVGKTTLLAALRAHVPSCMRDTCGLSHSCSGMNLLDHLDGNAEIGSGGIAGSSGVVAGLHVSSSNSSSINGSSQSVNSSSSSSHGCGGSSSSGRCGSSGVAASRRHAVIVWKASMPESMKAYAMRWRSAAGGGGGSMSGCAAAHTPILVVCNMADVNPCPLPEMNAMRGTKMPALAISAVKGTNVGALWLLLERSITAPLTPLRSPLPARRAQASAESILAHVPAPPTVSGLVGGINSARAGSGELADFAAEKPGGRISRHHLPGSSPSPASIIPNTNPGGLDDDAWTVGGGGGGDDGLLAGAKLRRPMSVEMEPSDLIHTSNNSSASSLLDAPFVAPPPSLRRRVDSSAPIAGAA